MGWRVGLDVAVSDVVGLKLVVVGSFGLPVEDEAGVLVGEADEVAHVGEVHGAGLGVGLLGGDGDESVAVSEFDARGLAVAATAEPDECRDGGEREHDAERGGDPSDVGDSEASTEQVQFGGRV